MAFTSSTQKRINYSLAFIVCVGLIGYVFTGFGFNKTDKTEAIAATDSTSVAQTLPPTYAYDSNVSCNGLVILFDKNNTQQIVVTPIEQNCFNWFADQITNGHLNSITVTGRSSCDSPTSQHALELSQKRADVVKQALINSNINPSKITAIGIGDTQPLGDCYTTDGINRNRSAVVKGN